MLAFSLADTTNSIDAPDTCTPGSPNYVPGDPVCALYPGATPDVSPPEIQFNPVNVRTSCPSGFSLIAGTCVPMNAVTANALSSIMGGLGPVLLVAGSFGAIYGISHYLKKRK